MQKLTMEQISDLSEFVQDPEFLEENDRTEQDAEQYHFFMLETSQPGIQYISREAAQALRAASPISRTEFLKKWG